MCLILKPKDRMVDVTEDIPVYKILYKDNTSVPQKFLYEKGKTYHTKLVVNSFKLVDPVKICFINRRTADLGFFSCMNKETALIYKEEFDIPTGSTSFNIVKMMIPRGAKAYLGIGSSGYLGGDDITEGFAVSDTIVATMESITPI